jgi:hypothetical protein
MNSPRFETRLGIAFLAKYTDAVAAAYLLARDDTEHTALMPALVKNMLLLVRDHLDTTDYPHPKVQVAGVTISMKKARKREVITNKTFKELFELTGRESCLWLALPKLYAIDAAFILCKLKPPDGVNFTNPYSDGLLLNMMHLIHDQLGQRKEDGNLETITQEQFRTLAVDLKVNIESVVATKPAAPDKHDDTPGQGAAPVVALGTSGGVESDQAGLLPIEQGLSTNDIANAFVDVNGWNVERWTKNLSASKWLQPARIAIGEAGGASSLWNPVMLAQLMHDRAKGELEKEKLMKVLNSRFIRIPSLGPWRDAFNEYFETHCRTD